MTQPTTQTEESLTAAHPLILNWNTIPVEDLPDGVKRQMVVGEKMMICRLTFPPHAIATPHSHPHEQMTIVEKGQVRFLLNDEERVVTAGDVITFPPNIWHGATMLEEEVVLVDIFTPLREDFLKK